MLYFNKFNKGGDFEMTKAEMISTIAEKNELTKAQAERVFNSVFDMFHIFTY